MRTKIHYLANISSSIIHVVNCLLIINACSVKKGCIRIPHSKFTAV